MKITSTLFLLLFGVMIHPKLSAQVDTKVDTNNTIEINFRTKEVKMPRKNLKNGDLYYLKIADINMNLYKISFDNKDSTITSSVSFPTFEIVGLDGLTKLLANLTELTTFSENMIKPLFGLPKVSGLKLQIIDEMNENTIFLKRREGELIGINLSLDSLNFKIQTLYLSYLANDVTLKNELKGNFSYKDILTTSEKYRTYIKTLIKTIQDNSILYAKFYTENKPVIDNDTILKKIDKDLKEAYSTTIDSAEKVYTSIGSEKVIGWLSSIIHLQNNSGTDFISLPLQLNGDITTLTLNVEPKKEEYGLPKYQTELSFPAPHKIYIGIGMSFYTSTLYNDAYSVKANVIDSATSNYSIIDEKPTKNEIGIATLLHFGRKLENCDIGFHGSIGPALSISKTVKPRLAIGAGLSYGKKQMLTFDILGMGGFVDRKSEVFSINDSYSSRPEQITVSKLSFGWGISLGYIYKF